MSLFRKDPNTLLKEATAKKKAGDLEGAIKLLREAYKGISKEAIIYPVATFLRLPLYLQEAGRSNEALQEFYTLLTKGYPNQIKDEGLIFMNHKIIYDKMRLFFQREGKNDVAVRFGIFSYLSEAIALYHQKRKNELKVYVSRENLESTIKKLLKKAKKENLTENLASIVEEQIKYLPDINFEELTKRIDRVVCEKVE